MLPAPQSMTMAGAPPRRACGATASRPAQPPRARLAAAARFGGDSGLILPGGPGGRPGGPPGQSGRLILPGQGQGGAQFGRGAPGQQQRPGGRGGLELGGDGGSLPLPTSYRPPPGFMSDSAADPALSTADPQELLNRLRARAGRWFDLARTLPVLYAKGLDNNSVAEVTGVNPSDQNRWIVAGTVYDSIAASPGVEPELLAAFDADGDGKLIHFRFLPAERRVAAARFIVAHGLDEQGCEALARAMKEWERRPGERTGFSNSPGDCMAFKHLRDAAECRLPDEARLKLEAALAAADSDPARERLADWRDSELEAKAAAAGSSVSSRAVLSVLRLSQDELGFRPLPQVSPLQSCSVDELLWAPTTSQEGAFGAFELQQATSPGQKWIALPQWKALALARHPVALPLLDCAAEPAVLAASRAKTDEEKKKLTGVGLLVVDTRVLSPLDTAAFYLVRSGEAGQQLALVDGASLAGPGGEPQGPEPVATVLFLCRPPNRDSAITSSELLQL